MIDNDLAAVTLHRRYPSVSLLVSLDPAQGAWPSRLLAARREAERRLALEPAGADPGLLSALDAAVEEASAEPGARGLAVFVNTDTATAVSLPVDVRDRVVIDETFATRDLVHAVNRTTAYWVLLLDQRRPRLLRGTGGLLQPARADIAVDIPSPPSAEQRRRGRSGDPDPGLDRRFRAIDEAIAPAITTDDAPLLVVGIEPALSQFAGSTKHQRRVSGTVRRRTDGPLPELAVALQPHLEALFSARCDAVLDDVGRNLSKGRVALGIDDAWAHATIGGGDTLVVEDSYECAARIHEWGLEHTTDRAAPDVVDDVVDELIELVLARGGRVQIVPDGRLNGTDRLALLTHHDVGRPAVGQPS